jgi:hypothetical protein
MTTTNLGKHGTQKRNKFRAELQTAIGAMKEEAPPRIRRMLVIIEHWAFGQATPVECLEAMKRVVKDRTYTLHSAILTCLRGFLRSNHDLSLEILALRQQLAVLKRQHPRPSFRRRDRLFWVAMGSVWHRWSGALLIVKPETVVGWHRAEFRLYWRFRSPVSRGRRRINREIHAAIDLMRKENPS